MTKKLFIFFLLTTGLRTFGQRLEIYGFIFDRKDSLPLKNANVNLFNDKDSLLQTISSDEKGHFIFNKTTTGTYYVTVDKKTFKAKRVDNLKFNGLPNCALRIPLDRKK